MKQPRSAKLRRAATHAAGGGKRHRTHAAATTPAAVRSYLAAIGRHGGEATGPTKQAGARKGWKTKRANATQPREATP